MTTAESLVQSIKFLSVSKFVNFINENQLAENIKNVKIYYKGSYTFKNKFNDLCVKPVYIIIFTDSKPVYLNHEKLLSLFDAQPVISFKMNKMRRMPEGRNRLNMFYLTIDFKQQETKEGYKYYPIEIHKETNDKVIGKIESLRIKTYEQTLDDMTDIILDLII